MSPAQLLFICCAVVAAACVVALVAAVLSNPRPPLWVSLYFAVNLPIALLFAWVTRP